MRRVLICWICFVAACSGASSLPVAPAPSSVNVFQDVIEVPEALCAPLEGWYAMSPQAVRAMLDADVERERDCSAKVARAQTAERVAQEQRAAALEALEHAQWWSRWGPFVVLTVGGLGTVLGIAGGALIRGALEK
jgi:hypothetical protein